MPRALAYYDSAAMELTVKCLRDARAALGDDQ